MKSPVSESNDHSSLAEDSIGMASTSDARLPSDSADHKSAALNAKREFGAASDIDRRTHLSISRASVGFGRPQLHGKNC